MRFRIDLKIFIFFAIFYFTHQLNIYFWTLFFGFIHELGHLIMGIILGFQPRIINMTPFGFSLNFDTSAIKSNKNRIKSNILVAISGPITNLIIIFIVLFLHISFIEIDIIVYINLLIFAFNLIPMYPLDGGRILKSILELFYTNIESEIIVNKVSNFYIVIFTMIGSIALYYFKNIAIFFITIYLWILVIKENKRILIKRKAFELIKKNIN